MIRSLILFLFVPLSLSSASSLIFKSDYPFYKGADIFTVEISDSPFNSQDLCREIPRQNLNVSSIYCRRAGEFERSKAFIEYGNWLSKNLYTTIDSKHLSTRDDSVKVILQEQQDSYILFVHKNETGYWIVLFHGGGYSPKALYLSTAEDIRDVYTEIALNLFNSQQEPKLSAKQKRIAKETPNNFYRERVAYDIYGAFGLGYTCGYFQDTDGGIRGKPYGKTMVQNEYSKADNVDARLFWNWLDRGEPLADVPVLQSIVGRPLKIIKGGVQYANFIGASLTLKYSDYDVRYNTSSLDAAIDSLKSKVSEWNFQRYEIGINLNIAQVFYPTKILEISPRVILGMHYTFYDYDYDGPGTTFEIDKMKGASIAFATQFLLYNRYGIQLETGTAYRGNNSAYYNEVTISSAYDYYILFNLVYVARTFLD